MSEDTKQYPIEYVLIMPDSGHDTDATFFQGWNRVIENEEFIRLLHVVSSLPFHTSEVFMTHEQLLKYRGSGVERIVSAVGQRHLSSLAFRSTSSLTVYVCMPQELGAVEINRRLSVGPSLVLSFSEYDSTTINLKNNSKIIYNLSDREICCAIEGA